MMGGLDIDAAIFDLGGVLMRNGRHSDFVRRFPPEHADAALALFMGDLRVDGDHPWHRLERGEISFAECQVLNRDAFAAAGISMPPRPATPPPAEGASPESPAPLITFVPNDEMLDLVARLRGRGVRTGILTNNVAEFRDAWRVVTGIAYGDLFDDIVDSHEVGLRKPNPAIYELALTRLSARPERTVFLDDLPANVDAAIGVGMYGVVVDEDASEAIAAVERLAGLA